MKKVDLKEIENRARLNSKQNKDKVERFKRDLKGKGLKKGRMRPRDPTEQKILDSFVNK